jgi:hypothetical protein
MEMTDGATVYGRFLPNSPVDVLRCQVFNYKHSKRLLKTTGVMKAADALMKAANNMSPYYQLSIICNQDQIFIYFLIRLSMG